MLKSFSVRVPVTLVGMGSSRNIGDLVKKLNATKALIITDAGVLKAGLLAGVTSSLDKSGYRYAIFDGCRPGVPASSIEQCAQIVKTGAFDILIGIGGGSVMDTAKAVSVMAANGLSFREFVAGTNIRKTLPKILVPTTSGTGSEWSRTGVYYDDAIDNRELIIRDDLFADAAVIDPELTLGLPPKVTADSGIDALTHAIEAFISPKANIMSETFSESAIRLVSRTLRHAFNLGKACPEARSNMAIAASLGMGATVLASSGLAHIMNPEIVKRTGATHGEACILLLPHTMQFNLSACPDKFARIAEMMGETTSGISPLEAAQKAVAAVSRLAADVGLPHSLSAFGIKSGDLSQIAGTVIETRSQLISANNPRAVSLPELVQICGEAL